MTEPVVWSNGVRCPVSLTVAMDLESFLVGMNPAYAHRPVLLSLATLGAERGIPEVLRLFAEEGITSTFFIPAEDGESYPHQISAIAAAGHELAHHGYRHAGPRAGDLEDEVAELDGGAAVIERLSGKGPVGYRCPPTESTVRLLSERSYTYSMNFATIQPYIHPGTELVELPHTGSDLGYRLTGLDRHQTSPLPVAVVLDQFKEQFQALYALGAPFIPMFHPMFLARPSWLSGVRDLIRFIRSHRGVSFTTCESIALDVVRTSRANQGAA